MTTTLQTQISRLSSARSKLDHKLSSLRKKADSARPWLDCLRCGHHWQGLWPDRPPRYCTRCHSGGWNIPPVLANSRKPSDAPNPNWDRRSKKPRVEFVATFSDAPASQPVPVTLVETRPPQEYLPPVLDTPLLGLPAIGLPPPPSLDTGLPPLPRVDEPMGEEFARPTEPEPEPALDESAREEEPPDEPIEPDPEPPDEG